MTLHDVVILAAGGSTRLGEPKQALRVNGETLLARTVRLAASTRPASTVVVLGNEEALWQRDAVAATVLRNPRWRSGMASSLQLAATHLAERNRPTLVLVVDQPTLDEAHLRALIDAFDGSADVVTAYGDAMGVPALVRPATLAGAQALEGDSGLRKLWRTTMPVTVRADGLALDLDTPADLATARARHLIDPAAHDA